MIGEPPSLAGANHDTVSRPFPAVTTTAVGTPGVVRGTADTTTDDPPAPLAFTARTATRYVTPFARFDNVNDVAVDDRRTHVAPPSSEYSYRLIDAPPLNGAESRTLNDRFPGVTDNPDGTPGTVDAVTVTELDAAPAPAAFTARTRTRADRPFTKPGTVPDRDAPDDPANATHTPLFTEYS